MTSLLYVTWDGPGAMYLRSLYFPILARLGMPVSVLQLTYGDASEADATRRLARELGIDFRARVFARRSSTWRTLTVGGALFLTEALRGVWQDPYRVVMARSIVPAAAVMMAGVPRQRFVFDADGLPADERVEFGGWTEAALPYRAARAIERAAIERAAVTLARTEVARDVLCQRAPGAEVLVARNGSDEERFRPLDAARRAAARAELGLSDGDLVVAYVGSLGPQYHPETMAALVRALRQQHPGRVYFMILTASEEAGRELLAAADSTGSNGHVERAEPREVPNRLGLADFGLAFRQPSLSQGAVAPIKVGEYLLCGVPVVTNRGVGDLDRVLSEDCAFLLPRPGVEEAATAAPAILARKFSRERVRALAVPMFGLGGAVNGYRAGVGAAEGRHR